MPLLTGNSFPDPTHFLLHPILRTLPVPCGAEEKTAQGSGERRLRCSMADLKVRKRTGGEQ